MNRFFGLLALVSAAHASPAAGLRDPVRIDAGMVQGVAEGAVTAFKGIPFAAPPVGDLRWRDPQPAAAWQGVRVAAKFGGDCMQRKTGAFGPWSAEYISASGMEGGSSEDCLYLNVWTGATSASEKRPVFVWIHGGGFSSGSGGVPIYDGAGLAAKGLVVVTINYRLGIFGFFAHPELTKESPHHSSGNYALLDMVAALHWVRRNIAAFGGDPRNVTIAGQSAGAFAVNYLMASPLGNGLFHRVIAESGGAFSSAPSLKDAEATGMKFAEGAAAATLAELRSKPAGELMNLTVPGVRMSAIVDGYVLPAGVYEIFSSGRQNDVPLLAGWNSADGVQFGPPPKAEAFREQARRQYGDLASEFLEAFPAGSDEEAAASQKALSRDQMFAWQGRLWARMQTKTGKSRVFLYYFDRTAPGTPEQTKFAAFHSGEIAYALNTLDQWRRPWEDSDRKLAAVMSGYWANFARNGDPNGKGLPRWPAYSEAKEQSMKFDSASAVIPTPDKAQLDFFDKNDAKRRAAAR